jgi:hypothetical protein
MSVPIYFATTVLSKKLNDRRFLIPLYGSTTHI